MARIEHDKTVWPDNIPVKAIAKNVIAEIVKAICRIKVISSQLSVKTTATTKDAKIAKSFLSCGTAALGCGFF